MKWRKGVRSAYVEDRRGQPARRGGAGLKLGGGLGVVVAIVGVLIFGTDFLAELPTGNSRRATRAGVQTQGGVARNDELTQFVHFVVEDIQDSWQRKFQAMGKPYQPAVVVLFSDETDSGCGFSTAAIGPFYCPADSKVYIDLTFYDALHRRFGAPGDFAQAYVMAHEFGHHIQNVLGISARTRREQKRRPREKNQLSVRLELQADCFAGIWAHDTGQRDLLERGDVAEGIAAASAIGDDTLQKRARGRVQPESFTHGSSAQRVRWFERGYASGKIEDCDAFAAARP